MWHYNLNIIAAIVPILILIIIVKLYAIDSGNQ